MIRTQKASQNVSSYYTILQVDNHGEFHEECFHSDDLLPPKNEELTSAEYRPNSGLPTQEYKKRGVITQKRGNVELHQLKTLSQKNP